MAGGKTRLEKFKVEHPVCCYCGGTKFIEEIEHAPPKTFFYGKHRPKGLEVPCCRRCNKVFSKFDDFFALLSFSQASFADGKVDARISKMISGCMKSFPDAVVEIAQSGKKSFYLNKSGLYKTGFRLRFQHHDIHFTMNFSIARLAASFYYYFNHNPLPIGSILAPSWYSNAQPPAPDMLDQFLKKLPSYYALKQGEKFDASDQFEARYVFAEDTPVGGCAFHFHRSFVGLAFLFPSVCDLPIEDNESPLFLVSENGIEPFNQSFPEGVRLPKRRDI